MGVICTFLSTFLKALNDFKIVLEKNRKEWGTKKMTGCSRQSVGSASCDLMWRGWGVVEGLLMLGFFSLFPGGSLVSSPALGGSAQPLCIHTLNPPVFRVTCCPSLCAVPENPWIDSLQGRSFRSVGSWRAITWPLPGCEGLEDGGKLASNSFLK